MQSKYYHAVAGTQISKGKHWFLSCSPWWTSKVNNCQYPVLYASDSQVATVAFPTQPLTPSGYDCMWIITRPEPDPRVFFRGTLVFNPHKNRCVGRRVVLLVHHTLPHSGIKKRALYTFFWSSVHLCRSGPNGTRTAADQQVSCLAYPSAHSRPHYFCPQDIMPSKPHLKVLEVITYVGCSLSLLGEILTILTLIFLK